jgi:asparagine synthase (glutamine-hydrolysing)
MHVSGGVGLAHVRLSIVDLQGGSQPMANEDGRVVITFNGEIYNHVGLREALTRRGHVFRTRSDTEVLVHGYEEWGFDVVYRLNGQFAFAIHDGRNDLVFLARDRFGVRPLFHTEQRGSLIFASEMKAIFASGLALPSPDHRGIDQVFTFWGARAPATVFEGVRALEPGSCAVWKDGRLVSRRWFIPAYEETELEPRTALAELDEQLRSAVALRMRADVPVGAYLSGGLDSSATTTLASSMSPIGLKTFSIAFDDPALNEAVYQLELAASLGTVHAMREIGPGDIARVFPEVVRHAETPLLRTAPAPMLLLARLVRERGIKVVLTGEGADELFLGYDLFKEAAARRHYLQSGSAGASRFFQRLYPSVPAQAKGEFWRKWFLAAGDLDDPLFSHMPRFLLTARIKEFYSAEMKAQLEGYDALAELRDVLPEAFQTWAPLHQAAYLELVTLLEPYLLSSQGDRMSLASGVEGRYPFLDHRLFAFTSRLPVRSKLRALQDKRILRRWAADRLPPGIVARPKQAYRAPDASAFVGSNPPEYVAEVLQPSALVESGFFDPRSVAGLVRRCRSGATSTRENQAFIGILSAQLWHQSFFRTRTASLARFSTDNLLTAQGV